jgi:metallophosphoesterase superfamily enzyme
MAAAIGRCRFAGRTSQRLTAVSFHDRNAHERLSDTDRDAIGALQARRDWIWILGNHDPAIPSNVGGVAATEVTIGPIIFRHEPTGAVDEIAGHLHPKA